VPVDRTGTPLHNCLIWLDTRSDAIARRITGGGPRIAGYGAFTLLRWLRLTNGAPNLSGKDPTSKILWFKEERHEIWERTHKVLDVKDWLLHRCCGAYVTTEDCAHLTWLLDTRRGRKCWSPAILDRLGIDRAVLPDVIPAVETAGVLTASAAEHLGLAAGTPVAAGAGDVNACALAAGTLAEGAYHMHVGTSMWLGTHMSKRRVDPTAGIATICAAVPDTYFLVATQESAGSAAAWAARGLGYKKNGAPDFEGFFAAAEAAKPALESPYFFPWLYGERVPVDNKYLRGGFANLSLTDGRVELARAVLEGVALNTRWAMEKAQRLGRMSEPMIRLMGGGTVSDLWCQILADVHQRPMQRMEWPRLSGALGAAMTAAVTARWFGDLSEATVMARAQHCFQPDPRRAEQFQGRFERFVEHYRLSRGWYRRLSE
jgi:xylulokinase